MRLLSSFVLFVTMAGCRDLPTADVTDLAPPLPAGIAQLAVVHDVPVTGVPVPVTSTMASLIGHEAFRVEVDSVRRSMTGQFEPGRLRVTFRLRLQNVLNRARLVTPTWPAPPDDGEGLFLFVVQAVAVESPGGVTTVAPNELLVTVPGGGRVRPSADWDGAWYHYVRGTPCRGPEAGCARYEPFAAPLGAGAASEWRTVGFDIDPTVRHLRLRLVLLADLANAS